MPLITPLRRARPTARIVRKRLARSIPDDHGPLSPRQSARKPNFDAPGDEIGYRARMVRFYCDSRPIARPDDIVPFLAAQKRHWRTGRSAWELAHSWMGADGFPPTVAKVLATHPGLAGARLVEGHFEKTTEMPGRGRASQTDLLAICETPAGRLVIGVEGKVDETLGPLVREWDDGTPNRQARLAGILRLLEIDRRDVEDLRYQLLHRTAAALLDARAQGAHRAIMLVHSFDPGHASFDDFARFVDVLGTPCPSRGRLSDWRDTDGVSLCLGWCADRAAR